MAKTTTIDTDSPSKSWEKAIAAQQQRAASNAAFIEMNERIRRMAQKGATLAEIMTETGKNQHYIRRIAGSDLRDN